MKTPGLKYNLNVVYYTLRMITMWKPAPYVEISAGSIERTFHFSRRRISSMWFYRLSSELYFAKTGAQEESNRTGIRNYEWETGPATVLISSASCNFSSESGKASSVFIARAVKKKKVCLLIILASTVIIPATRDAVFYKKLYKDKSLFQKKKKYL